MHAHILYTNHTTLLLYWHITTGAPYCVSATESEKSIRKGKKLASKKKRDTQPRTYANMNYFKKKMNVNCKN